jgi:hypothetical protein
MKHRINIFQRMKSRDGKEYGSFLMYEDTTVKDVEKKAIKILESVAGGHRELPTTSLYFKIVPLKPWTKKEIKTQLLW